MADRKTTKPTRAPGRARPVRRRTHPRPQPAPITHHPSADISTPVVTSVPEPELKTELGGGGSSGHGPLDGDGGDGRRPDPEGGDAKRLLITLGILAVGAAIMSARLLSQAGRGARRFG